MSADRMWKLHGRMRGKRAVPEEFFNPTRPVESMLVDGVELKAGTDCVAAFGFLQVQKAEF